MSIVKMYQATDGSLHPSFEAFVAHQERTNILDGLEKNGGLLNYADCSSDDAGVPFIYPEDVGAFVANNAELLREVLKNAVVSKRGRPAKSVN